jgi:biotin transport system substrate-specific component
MGALSPNRPCRVKEQVAAMAGPWLHRVHVAYPRQICHKLALEAEPTLASTLWPASRTSPIVRNATLMIVGTVLLWLSAKIYVPLYPVPITMQTLVVLVLGIAYGSRLGMATMALYLLEGAVGLPVFSGGWSEGGGFHHLYGPTAGYLFGFVVAAGVCGKLAERGWDRHIAFAAAAMVIGNLIVYAMGLTWLTIQAGFANALEYGLVRFLVGDALKIALGTCALPVAWRRISQRKG